MFFYIRFIVGLCVSLCSNVGRINEMILDLEWQIHTYIYISFLYTYYIFYFIYIIYIFYIYYFIYIYIIYIFVCCILKHLLNTDILVENGTCISNAVSVSSRKCSIWCCFSIVKYHFYTHFKKLWNFVLFNVRGTKTIVKM